ncbi:MAG TPA: ATP-binding protein [Thermoguttaceae bacterium]|nr:ATP-binding protein [Thermoguttaceae bacterium]
MSTERFSRILVVEDNEPERRLLCEILEEEGFDLVGCGSAAEALEYVKQQACGVAVVDLRLPDFSGNELLEKIRVLDDEVRVIIYTGAASFDSVKEAINLGAFAYVEKLSDPGELLRHVHRACRERVDRYAADLEAAVAQRTEELARSNTELEDFASVVAHDLRSPLLTISGYCQILQEEYEDRFEEASREYLHHIVEGAGRMNRLIEDLLDYSRVGRSEEPFQPVDLESVLTETRANLDAAIRQNNAQLRSDPLPTVAGDETQLLQLFQNLIGNAIKFRRDADPVVRLSVSQGADHWQFAVADNGIGIEPNHFNRVFQVFHQLNGKEYPGTGIGLAICKKTVERHGGRIWLESQLGQGTTFYFTLPVRGG